MNIMVAPGSRSDGFITITLPVTKAIGNIHKGIMAGKLNGVIPECVSVRKKYRDKWLHNQWRRRGFRKRKNTNFLYFCNDTYEEVEKSIELTRGNTERNTVCRGVHVLCYGIHSFTQLQICDGASVFHDLRCQSRETKSIFVSNCQSGKISVWACH